jgi:hypothetical protein
MSERTVAGWQPWLPWPLSAWKWWTEPVRAEYLAVLRIGVAAVLLADILLTYLPQADVFYGPESLGSTVLFGYMQRPGYWYWTLGSGLGDPLLSCLALLAWLVCTALLSLGFWVRLTTTQNTLAIRRLLVLWLMVTILVVLGQWARMSPAFEQVSPLTWLAPGIGWAISTFFLGTDLLNRARRRATDLDLRIILIGSWVSLLVFVALGLWKTFDPSPEGPFVLRWVGARWDEELGLILGAMLVWSAGTFLLLVGLATRWSAVLVWILSTSFAHLNSYIDNHGDTVRGIILFYLMLCPCGAAWSVDAWLARRRRAQAGNVFVSPWPLRLLFVQMVFIYWMNGLYKAIGSDWNEGVSYYYVLCDLAIARFSYAQFPVPFWVTWLLTKVVLYWEVTFPLWMPFRRTRIAALGLGALFHLGIFVQMELGGFAPYMLCLYLPLLPWHRWLRHRF